MGKELQLRQKTFASFGITKSLLRRTMEPEEAREILGAACLLTEDKVRVWYVKMPDLRQATEEMPDIVSPDLHWLADEEADLNDYLKDPTHPVVCVPGPVALPISVRHTPQRRIDHMPWIIDPLPSSLPPCC